jgi:hypothetical protein
MPDQKLDFEALMEAPRSIKEATSSARVLKYVPSQFGGITIIRAIGGRALKAAFNVCARLFRNKLPPSLFSLAESFICSG